MALCVHCVCLLCMYLCCECQKKLRTATNINKTKVLSVQLGKTLSFVKIVVEWGGGGVKLWIVVH